MHFCTENTSWKKRLTFQIWEDEHFHNFPSVHQENRMNSWQVGRQNTVKQVFEHLVYKWNKIRCKQWISNKLHSQFKAPYWWKSQTVIFKYARFIIKKLLIKLLYHQQILYTLSISKNVSITHSDVDWRVEIKETT